MSLEDLRSGKYAGDIAKLMAKLHSQEIPNREKKSCCFKTIESWKKLIPSSYDKPELQKKFEALQFNTVIKKAVISINIHTSNANQRKANQIEFENTQKKTNIASRVTFGPLVRPLWK